MKKRFSGLMILALTLATAAAFAASKPPACTQTSWTLSSDWNTSDMYPNQSNPEDDSCGRPIWYFMREIPGAGYELLDFYQNGVLGETNMQQYYPLSPEVFDGYYQCGVPVVGKNFGNYDIYFTTPIIPANTVDMHPGPTHKAVIGWKSPFKGNISISAVFSDGDVVSGDGVRWTIRKNASTLAAGEIAWNGGEGRYATSKIPVLAGDFIYFVVDSGANNEMSYDTTLLNVTISKTR